MIEIYKDPKSDSICIVRYTDDSEDPDDMHVLPWHSAELDVVFAVPDGFVQVPVTVANKDTVTLPPSPGLVSQVAAVIARTTPGLSR